MEELLAAGLQSWSALFPEGSSQEASFTGALLLLGGIVITSFVLSRVGVRQLLFLLIAGGAGLVVASTVLHA